MRALARRLDHLGVFPALYAAAAVLAWVEWTDGRIPIPRGPTGAPLANPLAFSLAFAFLVGWSAFAIDRAKLRDRWLDPADRDAHPARFAFVARHARSIRVAIAGAIAGATLVAIAALDSPLLALLPAAAAIGTACYAPWPRGGRPRVKDRLLVKNLAVGVAFASFAAVVATLGVGAGVVAGALDTASASRAAAVTMLLAIRVAADAALCDLDDAGADARHGTRTLATVLGRGPTLGVAASVRAACPVALVPLAAAGLTGSDHAGVLAIAGVGVGGTAVLFAVASRRPAWRIGPLVDAGLAIEVAVSAALLSAPSAPAS